MPLVRITFAAGRPAADRRRVADAVHQALVDTANVPADDRFQVVQEVPADSLVWDAGYLGQSRSPQVVFIEITLNAVRGHRRRPRQGRRRAAGRRPRQPRRGPAGRVSRGQRVEGSRSSTP